MNLMVATKRRCAMPRSQYSGRTVSGPKKAKDPQRVIWLVPMRRPLSRAARVLMWGACQREIRKSRSPMNSPGLGRPINVPNATRKIRSASFNSDSFSGPTVMPFAAFIRSDLLSPGELARGLTFAGRPQVQRAHCRRSDEGDGWGRSMDARKVGRRGPAAIGAFQHGLVVSGEFHGEMQFAGIAQPDDVKGERAVVDIDVDQHMRIMADHACLAVFSGDDIEDDRALKISGVASQGDGYAGLVIQHSLPHTDPLFEVLVLRGQESCESQRADCQEIVSGFHFFLLHGERF